MATELNRHLARLLDRLWFWRLGEMATNSPMMPVEEKMRYWANLELAERDYAIFIKHHPELAGITENVSYMNKCLQAGLFKTEPYTDRQGELFPYKDER